MDGPSVKDMEGVPALSNRTPRLAPLPTSKGATPRKPTRPQGPVPGGFYAFFWTWDPFLGVREHVLGVERIGFGIGCSLFLFFPVAFVEDVGFLFTFASKQYAANLCQGVPRNVTCST